MQTQAAVSAIAQVPVSVSASHVPLRPRAHAYARAQRLAARFLVQVTFVAFAAIAHVAC